MSSEVPAVVASVAGLMSSFRAGWFLCGGWAVDAWLGGGTRSHGDVDVSVFRDDLPALFDHFAGWDLIAHDPLVPDATTEPWDGRRLELPAHIHATPVHGAAARWVSGSAAVDGELRLEIIVNEASGHTWVVNAEPRVTIPLGRAIGDCEWGLPAAAPEVLCFYKATAYFDDKSLRDRRSKDEADFVALVPRIDVGGKGWLRDAIAVVSPRHPWLTHLATV